MGEAIRNRCECVREGSDVTIVALARMVSFAEKAAATLAKDGISCEIIDPRTTSPFDEDTILESVENTGRLIATQSTGDCNGRRHVPKN